jgi:uncharacterized protein YjbJ (UPF0337 family)
MDLNNNHIDDSTELRARGNWNDLKGRAKQKWASLTEDDLAYEEGKQDEWLGRLQEKTGQAAADLKAWFDEKAAHATISRYQAELRARSNWNEIKGLAKQKWASLTDDDLNYAEGKQDEWLGELQRKTGQTIDELRAWFDEKSAEATASLHSAELQARSNWDQVKAEAKQKWASLTDDDLTYEAGKQDEWFARLQEKTGQAVADLKAWFERKF